MIGKAFEKYGTWKCRVCETIAPATVHQKRKTYCSKGCMASDYKVIFKGSLNPNYSNAGYHACLICNIKFKSYQKNRKFCSLKCRNVYGLSPAMRNNARKDNNHNMIVDILKKGGVVVKDLSKAMNGIPDILVWHFEKWHLIEIKNPKTDYGKKGLNPKQQKWAEEWRGGPVFIIRTEDDANKFLIGEFADIDQVKGLDL
jgi:hypothetical protein